MFNKSSFLYRNEKWYKKLVRSRKEFTVETPSIIIRESLQLRSKELEKLKKLKEDINYLNLNDQEMTRVSSHSDATLIPDNNKALSKGTTDLGEEKNINNQANKQSLILQNNKNSTTYTQTTTALQTIKLLDELKGKLINDKHYYKFNKDHKNTPITVDMYNKHETFLK